MNQTINKFAEHFAVYLLLLSASFIIVYSYGYTMFDDGWRHLAMAFHKEEMVSWGNVFMHSLYGEYDPWFMWHELLGFIGSFTGQNSVHVAVNTVVYFLLSLWFFLILSEYSSLKKTLIILLAIGLPQFFGRYFFLRPDLLSGLFLLYAVLIRSRVILALVSAVYSPFYYLFWFYLGILGFAKFVLKEYKELLVLIVAGVAGVVFHLSYDSNGYLDIVNNVLNNEKLLQGYSVIESKSSFIPDFVKSRFGSGTILLFLMGLSVVIFYLFKPKERVLGYIILFSPVMLSQDRFFHLLQPLIYVYAIILLCGLFEYKGELISKVVEQIKQKSYFGDLGTKGLYITLFISVTLLFSLKFIMNKKEYDSLEKEFHEAAFFKNGKFKNKKIFIVSNMGTFFFLGLYNNPSARYVPSCSLGWVDYDQRLKDIYFKIMCNSKELKVEEFMEFVNFNGFDFIVVKAGKEPILFSDELFRQEYELQERINGNLIFKKSDENI